MVADCNGLGGEVPYNLVAGEPITTEYNSVDVWCDEECGRQFLTFDGDRKVDNAVCNKASVVHG